MKTMILALAFVGAVHPVKIALSHDQVAGCSYVGQVKSGNMFNTYDKATAVQSVMDDAAKMAGDTAILEVTSSQHPKLGKKYTASASVWKCSK